MKKITILALTAACGVCGASSTIWNQDETRVPRITASASGNVDPVVDNVRVPRITASASGNVDPVVDNVRVPRITASSSGRVDNNDTVAAWQDESNNDWQTGFNWSTQSQTTKTTSNTNTMTGSALPEMDPAMREWFNSNLPKSEHADLFGKMLGTWATTTTWRMEPDAPAETTYGTCTNSAALQRFVQHEMTGELMPGLRFQGKALFGFNNQTREYECVWLDSTSTGMTIAKGQKGKDGSITWTSSMTDPNSGQKVTTKSVMSFDGADKMRYTIFANTSDGREFPALEITYSKVTQHADRVQKQNEQQRRQSEAKLRGQRHSDAGDR